MGFHMHGRKLIQTHVQLTWEPQSEGALSTWVGSSTAGQVRGDHDSGKYVLITYDVKVDGEAITAPTHRIPPYRSPRHKKLTQAVVNTRGECRGELHGGDLYMVWDGGKHGNESSFPNIFVTEEGRLSFKKSQLTQFYSEQSIVERYKKLAGTMVNQRDSLHIFGKQTLNMNGRKRKHYEGSNRGDMIGPVNLAAYSSPTFWRMTEKMKRELFGKQNRVAVGGPSPVEAVNEEERIALYDLTAPQPPVAL